jgi:pentatricopeptide repeat domain-containing protein 1
VAKVIDFLFLCCQVLSDEDWYQRERGAKAQCQEAVDAVRGFERSHGLSLRSMPLTFLQQRAGLVSFMLKQGNELELKDEVVHDGVLLLDRTMSTGADVASNLLPVVTASALSLSIAQGEPAETAPSAAQVAKAAQVDVNGLLDMQWQVRQLLQNDTLSISAMRCIKVYLERMGYR